MNPELIVPPELQHALQEACNTSDDSYYFIGDAGNTLKRAVAQLPQDKRPKLMDIYRAIGYFSGKAANTVRSYCDVSEFWDKDLREEFPQFGRHHVIAVIPHAEGEDIQARRRSASGLLYKALDETNGIPTVDWLRAWLREDNGKPAWELAWERLRAAAERFLERDDLPIALRKAVKAFLDNAGGTK